MKRFLGVIIVAMLALGAFAPASAVPTDATVTAVPTPVPNPLDDLVVAEMQDQIPFRQAVPAQYVNQNLPSAGDDLGFFGVCAPDQTGCVGVSQVARSQGGKVVANTAGLTVAGVICIRSYKAPCVSSTGSPGSGVFLTEVTPTYPQAYAEYPFVTVDTCVWNFAPRDTPTRCTKDLVNALEIQPVSVELPEDQADAFMRIAAPNGIGIVIHEPIR